MLKIIIAALLCVLPILTIAQTKQETGKSALIYLNNHNRSCFGGIGFCQENVANLKTSQSPNTEILKISKNQILIITNTNAFFKEELIALKKEPYFVIDEKSNIIFTEEVLNKIEIETHLNTIQKGSYPIVIEDDKVKITFTLVEKQF